MLNAEQLNKDTDFNSIVIVQRDILLSQGNRQFIKRYDKYGYGFLYQGKDDCISDGTINIVIPNTTSIDAMEYRFYVNLFYRCDCKIIKTSTINSLPHTPIIERINLFCSLPHKFAMFD